MEAVAAVTGREPTLTRYSAAILARTQTYDIAAAKRDLGYSPPVSFAEGMERTLAAWENEMTAAPTSTEKGIPELRCHVLDTGYTVALESFLMRGGALREVRCHSIVALLDHPAHGWTLFDTGYAPRIFAATRRLPFYIYRLVTPLHVRAELAAVAQLPRLGLQRSDIKRVVILSFPRRPCGRAS